MKLINTTNSHSQLVKSQLESTDATLVEVYSAGIQMLFLLKLRFTMKSSSQTNTALFVNLKSKLFKNFS